MLSSLLNVILQFGGAAVVIIFTGLISRNYFASQFHNKLKGYQKDIVKSHAKILELEAKNSRLLNRLKDLEGIFSKDRFYMN